VVSRRCRRGTDPLALVRDPPGEIDPQAFLAGPTQCDTCDILRWSSAAAGQVTFEEVRAIWASQTRPVSKSNSRTTPVCSALYSIVTLWAQIYPNLQKSSETNAAWYPKSVLTFSDAIARVAAEIWAHQILHVPAATEIVWNSNQSGKYADALAYAPKWSKSSELRYPPYSDSPRVHET